MGILVISTSLKAASRSRVLAREAHRLAGGVAEGWLDLREQPLPFCDAGGSHGHAAVVAAAGRIRAASAVLIAAPVYNFDLSAAAKNLIENTGKAWEDKVVGFLAAAGGQRSYMAVQVFAGSLALDFRTLVVPRFVYATREQVDPERILDAEVAARVAELVRTTADLAARLAAPVAAAAR
jgi:NAD(P)H-dependent FMN reductase